MVANLTFRPHPLARNRHFQTIVSSLKHSEDALIRRTARQMILEADQDVRLQGFYSPQPEGKSKGLVLLLHGWLGSANSGYNLAIGDYLYRRGYAIFRLNLRDHGDTHHLNIGPFRGDLLDETFAAARQIAQLAGRRPFFMVGFSLGGNFALRLAWRHHQTPLPDLARTIAICPALNPQHTTLALDTGFPLYLAYFRRKWRKSMRRKQAAFPGLYDFSAELAAKTCLAMTEAFVRRHSPYPDARAYFDSYTVTPAMLAALRTPTTLIAAEDDPIVPIADFQPLAGLSPSLQLYLQPYGGHVGFIDLFPYRCWIGEAILRILES